jgi:hypothetical protein
MSRRLAGRRSIFQVQVSPPTRVCFHEVQALREQREYAVREAAQRERAAWAALERASQPKEVDETNVSTLRGRWQATARSLVDALGALKR